MQGLNTTAVHAHGALYGVYGTLGLGLDAILPPSNETENSMEGKTDLDCVLGNKYRNVSGNRIESFAGRFVANLSIGQRRLLVSALARIYAN